MTVVIMAWNALLQVGAMLVRPRAAVMAARRVIRLGWSARPSPGWACAGTPMLV
jgi:hypothetical protein